MVEWGLTFRRHGWNMRGTALHPVNAPEGTQRAGPKSASFSPGGLELSSLLDERQVAVFAVLRVTRYRGRSHRPTRSMKESPFWLSVSQWNGLPELVKLPTNWPTTSQLLYLLVQYLAALSALRWKPRPFVGTGGGNVPVPRAQQCEALLLSEPV